MTDTTYRITAVVTHLNHDTTGRIYELSIGGVQGPPGIGADDALLIANRLSEFDTPQKRLEARQNLGVQVIDGGTWF